MYINGGHVADQQTTIGVRQDSLSDLGGRAAHISNDISVLRRRLIMINGALTGGSPAEPPNGPKPVPSGMVGMLGESLSEISNNLAHISDEIERISAALGIDQPPQGTRG